MALPSPPVPQVSITIPTPSARTPTARSRIAEAKPTTSSTVSPLRRSAVTSAPNWAGVTASSMISSITACACASLRPCPPTSSPIACADHPATPAGLGATAPLRGHHIQEACEASPCLAGVRIDSGWNWTP